MLITRPKISELAFRVFGRSLHPELFDIYATRTLARQNYQARIDITSAGHVVTWRREGLVVTEVATSSHQMLPRTRELISRPLTGVQKDGFEFRDVLRYGCRFQLEPADLRTFAALQHELDRTSECEGLMFRFQASGRMAYGAVSYVHILSRQDCLAIRAFHTFPDAYAVVKTESSFSLIGARPDHAE